MDFVFEKSPNLVPKTTIVPTEQVNAFLEGRAPQVVDITASFMPLWDSKGRALPHLVGVLLPAEYEEEHDTFRNGRRAEPYIPVEYEFIVRRKRGAT